MGYRILSTILLCLFQFLLLTIFNLQANILTTKDILSNLGPKVFRKISYLPYESCLVLVPPIGFCFVGLPFLPSASWPLSLFFLFLRPCLIHARMPDWGGAFMHGHTFLHSCYVPVQSSSCSLRVFYRTLAIGRTPINKLSHS